MNVPQYSGTFLRDRIYAMHPSLLCTADTFIDYDMFRKSISRIWFSQFQWCRAGSSLWCGNVLHALNLCLVQRSWLKIKLVLKTLKTYFFYLLIAVSEGIQHISSNSFDYSTFCIRVFLPARLTASIWAGLSRKRRDVMYFHASIRIQKHFNQSLMSVMGVFESRPPSIKSDQTTPTEFWWSRWADFFLMVNSL